MAYHGGVDKRAIAAGGQAMTDEVMRVVPPLFEEGGYIPGCDHGVPPDISWPNFVEYTRLLAQLTGWLDSKGAFSGQSGRSGLESLSGAAGSSSTSSNAQEGQ